MQWIFQFLFRHRSLTSLLLTVTLSVLMLQQKEEGRQRTARMLTVTVFYPFHLAITKAALVKDIFAENKRLRREIADLTLGVARLREQADENRRLHDLLGFRDSIAYDLCAVRIIAREPSFAYRSVVIDAGKNERLEPFLPVVDKNGVVGKIVQVMPALSMVQLLRDPSNRTSVLTHRTRLVGILETENGDAFYIRYRADADVVPHDEVVTSGLGGIYPKGLSAGTVERVEADRDPLFKKAFVRLGADFEHLEEAFVLRLSPQWSSFRAELDTMNMGQR
jgi:rod shape-determining protein MreC